MRVGSLRDNTAPSHYLSGVWLEHCHRRRAGAYVNYGVCEPGPWNADFYKVKPLPNELGPAVLRHTLRHYVRSVDERASKPLHVRRL